MTGSRRDRGSQEDTMISPAAVGRAKDEHRMISNLILPAIAIVAIGAAGYNMATTAPGQRRSRGPLPRAQVHTKRHHNN